MGRRKKPCYCRKFSGFNLFKPSGIPLSQLVLVQIALDDLEALQLCDFEGYDHARTAMEMRVSRVTLQRLLYSGPRKVIDAVMHGKALTVQKADHVVIRRPGWRGPARGREHGRRGKR